MSPGPLTTVAENLREGRRRQTRAAQPVVPRHLFRSPIFNVAPPLLGMVVIGLGMLAVVGHVPTCLQTVYGRTATESGLLTLPMVVGITATALFSSRFTDRLAPASPRRPPQVWATRTRSPPSWSAPCPPAGRRHRCPRLPAAREAAGPDRRRDLRPRRPRTAPRQRPPASHRPNPGVPDHDDPAPRSRTHPPAHLPHEGGQPGHPAARRPGRGEGRAARPALHRTQRAARPTTCPPATT